MIVLTIAPMEVHAPMESTQLPVNVCQGMKGLGAR